MSSIKDTVINCIKICGGITGKHFCDLCNNDESIIQDLIENYNLRKIPLTVKTSDKKEKVIFVIKQNKKLDKDNSIMAASSVEEAYLLAVLNDVYIKNKDNVFSWLNENEIKSFCNSFAIHNNKYIPNMMYYLESESVAIYAHKLSKKFNNTEKENLIRTLGVDKIIEITY